MSDSLQPHELQHCYAKSLQSCPTLCDPIDGSPQGSPVPGILQARTREWVAISCSNAWKWKVNVKLLSRVRLLATPWTAAYQAPPSIGFSKQEYWSGVPLNCSTPGFYVLHYLPEFAQTHVHWVSDATQPSHPLLPPSPLAFNLSQHQGLFQWVCSSHQVAKVLEHQHQSFQWIFWFYFLGDWLVWSPCSPKGLSSVYSFKILINPDFWCNSWSTCII